jgi:hypothetical protein
MNSNKLKKTKLRLYCPKPRKSLTMIWMMLKQWTRWFYTLKLLLSETNSFKKTKSLSPNGLRSKRSLILWWKLKDWRYSKKKKSEKPERLLPESKVLKSLSIKFKRELLKEWRNKKLEIKKDSSSCQTLKKWKLKIHLLLKLRDKELTCLWNKLQKLTLNLSLKKKKDPKKKKIKKMKLFNIKKPKISRSTRPNLMLKELKTRKKEKFKDWESFKKKLPTDKQKSMLSELKELLKKVKDKPEKEKD